MRVKASALILLLAVGALASCSASADPAPAVSASTSASAIPTMTPTRTPTPDVDDPSTWVITDEGMGPIHLGMPFSDALAAMPSGTTNDPDRCSLLAWWTAPEAAYQLYASNLSYTVDNGPIEVVSAEGWSDPSAAEGPQTAEGIGVGSSVDEVLAAYPDAVEMPDSIDGTMVHLKVGRMFFTYRETPVVSSVSVTTAEMPPYEVCG